MFTILREIRNYMQDASAKLLTKSTRLKAKYQGTIVFTETELSCTGCNGIINCSLVHSQSIMCILSAENVEKHLLCKLTVLKNICRTKFFYTLFNFDVTYKGKLPFQIKDIDAGEQDIFCGQLSPFIWESQGSNIRLSYQQISKSGGFDASYTVKDI